MGFFSQSQDPDIFHIAQKNQEQYERRHVQEFSRVFFDVFNFHPPTDDYEQKGMLHSWRVQGLWFAVYEDTLIVLSGEKWVHIRAPRDLLRVSVRPQSDGDGHV